MRNYFSKSKSLLTLSFLLLGVQSASAEKGSNLRAYRAHNFKKTESFLSSPTPSQTLLDKTATLKKQLTLSNDDQLVPYRSEQKKPGFRHSKMNQRYKNIPIFGAEVILNETLSSNTVRANIIKGLDRLDVNTDPNITRDEAFRFATDDYNKNEGALIPSTLKTSALELLPKDDSVSLVWHLLILTEAHQDTDSNKKGPGRWHYFIGAEDGAIHKKFNANDTLSQASGPGGNAIYNHSWVNQLDVEPTETGSATYKAKTTRLATYDMAGSKTSGTLVTGILSSFGTAASNDAHGNAEITLNMLSEIFGYNSIDNAGFPIKSFVNYDSNYANAFWDGAEMVYGDGGNTFYPLSGAIDVVSHEINHGFTELHSALIYDGEAGGINESFSDIAGTAAEFYSDPSTANFDIAERVLKASMGRTALRFMCNPTSDNFSIDNFANYKSTTDVHSSSGIMNKAFCLAAKRFSSNGNPNGTAIGNSVLRVAKIFYEANDNYWLSSSTFLQACEGTLDAATALGYSLTEINWLKQSWSDVGVVCTASPNLNAPTLLTATTLSATSIRLNWTDNSSNETGFKIEMKTGAGAYSILTTTAANAVTYTATVAVNQTYTFRISATNANGVSTFSNEATTQTLIPLAPTLLTATKLSATSIRLNWRDNSSNETGFKIERKILGAQSFTQFVLVGSNVTTMTTVQPTTIRYVYRIRSFNSFGNSSYSNEISARLK